MTDRLDRVDAILLSALVIAFAFAGLLTLDDYGLTFDETWHFLAGHRYLRFWSTLDTSLLDFAQPHAVDTFRPDHPVFDRLPADEPRPPVANTLSAISCRVFFYRLGWLDAVDAHHLPIVLMGAGTLVVVYLLTREGIGRMAAVFATLALGLSPRFIAHSHFNIKDVPKTFLFSLAIWTFWKATKERSSRWMLASGVVFGLALGTRINAVLIPFVLAPWLAAYLLTHRRQLSDWPRSWWRALTAYPVVAAVTWVGAWPLMLVQPLATLRQLVDYWSWLGYAVDGVSMWSPYALIYILIVTPALTLLFAVLGVIVGLRESLESDSRTQFLLMLWTVVPLIRTVVPGATNYDGIRQFLEFLPAFCILGGLGMQRFLEGIEGAVGRRLPDTMALCLIACAFVPNLVRVIQIHPYQLAYFNVFIGGLPGAQRLNLPDATDYWGGSHRQGLEWLNAHAEAGSKLYIGEGNRNMVKPVANTWLREDISLLTDQVPLEPDVAPVYVSHVTRPVFYDGVDGYCEAHLEPAHSILVDGVPILNVFKLDAASWTEAVANLE